eukprot:TRINITY_DN0_c3620_g1_i2.p3 TRINITY_DN0_c3620_g1~~TRINITY_DN0_c3620_g1_i2.p3  ORF type:complete len:155 (+),score=5.34 TRINITY_DN0_c3620_g1_i2:1-465(+)
MCIRDRNDIATGYANQPNYYNQPPQPMPYQNQPPQAMPYQGPPPPGYYQNQPQGPPLQQPIIVVQQQQPSGAPDPNLFQISTGPVPFYCPLCQKPQLSRTYPSIGGGTHLIAIGLCFVTGLCCWIPYVADSCQDTVHSCPECRTEVGRKKFINL